LDSIGRYLKEKRESLGLSVEEVSNETKFKTYFINQIENDDFKAMGDPGFTKIMIITYTRALSADEDLVQKKINSIFDQPSEPPIKIRTVTEKKPIILPKNMIWFFSLFVLIAALGSAFYFLYQQNPDLLNPNTIKNSLIVAEKKDTKEVPVAVALPDTNIVAQLKLFDALTSVDSISQTPDLTPPVIATSPLQTQPPVTTQTPVRTGSPTFLTDQTDYVSHLIFGDKPNPLNPEI